MKQNIDLADVTEDILLLVNQQGQIIQSNKAAENLYGKNINNAEVFDIFEDTQSNLLQHFFQQALQTQNKQNFSLRYAHEYYEVKLLPNRENIAMSFRNIVENIKLRQTLTEMMEKLSFASKIAKIGYWELDLVAKKISWSSEMFRIFGIKNPDISVKKNIIREQMHKEDLPRYKDKLRKILKTGQPEEGIVRILRSDNQMIYCRYMADYIHYDKYNRKIVGTFQDLTEFIEIQHELEAAKEKAEKLNREKSYFLAQASHDLQQPISAMGLFIDNLLNANLNGKQQILVGKIHDSAQSLHNLLNNLLDISNLDAGGTKISINKFYLVNIIKNILKDYTSILKDKKITIKMSNCNHIIESDAFLVERILRNYIDNAVKYTKNKIVVGCLKYADSLKVMVLDNGVGIPIQEKKHIFSPYYQSKNRTESHSKGVGLGLAIVKKTADLLNVKVGVKSKKNKGSNFYLILKY